jgi:hypothetical protein
VTDERVLADTRALAGRYGALRVGEAMELEYVIEAST